MRKLAGRMTPILAAAFPILALYRNNQDEVTLSSLLPVLLVAMAAAALLAMGLSRLLKNGAHASLVATVWLLLFFLYGHVYNLVADSDRVAGFLDTHWFFLPIALALALLPLLPLLFKRTAEIGAVAPYVGAALAVLVAFNIIGIAQSEIRRLGQSPLELESVGADAGSRASELPDIYYIVPDRYPSSDTLESHYGYDNSEFIDYLEDSGFYVADDSFVNYHQTFLSLASSLNMDYLDALSDHLGEDSSDHSPAEAMIKDHRVWRTLKERFGYKFINFGSWWQPTMDNPNADVNVNKYPHLFGQIELKDGFTRMLLRNTVLQPFQDYVFVHDVFSQDNNETIQRCADFVSEANSELSDKAIEHCNRTLHTLREIKEMPSVEGPKFVFVHLLLPHPPFIFDPDGGLIEPLDYTYWDKPNSDEIDVLKSRFIEQLEFTNSQLEDTIDHILTESERPPIMVLQADEGPWTYEYLHTDHEEWSPETVRTRQKVLNAYHLPGDADEALYPSITPVNTFRVIFNEYMDADLPLLEDKAFISRADDRPYDFKEVTEMLE